MKLFASDYDGTLYFGEKISERNKDAIQRWRAAGNLFMVVTGRSLPSIQSALLEAEIEVDYLCANNGGYLYEMSGEVIYETYFDQEAIKKLLADLVEAKASYIALNDGINRYVVNFSESDYEKTDRNKFSEMISLEEAQELPKIAQVVVWEVEDEEGQRIVDFIHSNYKEFTAYRNINCVDIVPYGISKVLGCQSIAKRHKIPEDLIYTSGDSYNDLGMLLKYHGITLVSASSIIKEKVGVVYNEVADYIDEIM